MAESRNGMPGTGTALGGSINRRALALRCAWCCHVFFFQCPREIPRGEMSITIAFSMSNSLYFLFPQSLHLEGCCRGFTLQPDHALLSPLLLASKARFVALS